MKYLLIITLFFLTAMSCMAQTDTMPQIDTSRMMHIGSASIDKDGIKITGARNVSKMIIKQGKSGVRSIELFYFYDSAKIIIDTAIKKR